MLEKLYHFHKDDSHQKLEKLKHDTVSNSNVFESLMHITKYCSLGQITDALYHVGGQYRRNM